MNYIEYKITTTDSGIEEVTSLLLEHGINQTMVEGNAVANQVLEDKEKFHWDYVEESAFTPTETKIVFYIKEGEEKEILEDIEADLELLKEKCLRGDFGQFHPGEDLFGTLAIERNFLDDEDWMNSYKDHFKAIDLTNNIRVQPSWEKEYKGQKNVIILDPGMAFGTGSHETTNLCAKMLEKVSVKGKKVLDIGTGSGILAIISAKLGAKEVYAVDIDSMAVNVARENIIINNCDNIVTVKEGDLTKGLSYKAEIVVANLMAEIIMELVESLPRHMAEGGMFISSGILVEKANKVSDSLKNAGFDVIEIVEDGDWCVILARWKHE